MKKYDFNNLPIEIYADGPTISEINDSKKHLIKGYTFNPTLFRMLGVKDYLGHCKELIRICQSLPISLEVFADDEEGMIKQGRILGGLAKNVFVKIPITNTKGDYTSNVLKALVQEGIKLNVTAVFTKNQVETILPIINTSNSIISVFSGRIFDIGLDAVLKTRDMSDFIHSNSNCKVLWASPRMVYDIINACNANCDIITMQNSLIKKMNLFGKSPSEYSIETVEMFYNDASKSGYQL